MRLSCRSSPELLRTPPRRGWPPSAPSPTAARAPRRCRLSGRHWHPPQSPLPLGTPSPPRAVCRQLEGVSHHKVKTQPNTEEKICYSRTDLDVKLVHHYLNTLWCIFPLSKQHRFTINQGTPLTFPLRNASSEVAGWVTGAGDPWGTTGSAEARSADFSSSKSSALHGSPVCSSGCSQGGEFVAFVRWGLMVEIIDSKGNSDVFWIWGREGDS